MSQCSAVSNADYIRLYILKKIQTELSFEDKTCISILVL